MKEKKENLIFISDLGLASLLVTLDFEILELVKEVNSKRINFVFEKKGNIEKYISAYWNNRHIFIPIHNLFANQKMLKNRIYGIK